jgi:hypothetical protein
VNVQRYRSRFCTLLVISLGAFLAVGFTGELQAGGGPENLVLVVNQDDASSLLLANHYCQLRQIHPGNVIYLSSIPRQTTISLDQFRTLILKPVFDAIRDRKLDQQIDLIVYSSGFPASVNVGPARDAFFKEVADRGNPVPEEAKKIFEPVASLTSLTYFAISVIQNQPAYFSLNSNRYYRGPAPQLLSQPFLGPLGEEFEAAVKLSESGDYKAALEKFQSLQEKHPTQVAVTWQIARAHAFLKQGREATEALSRCVRNGLQYRGLILNEPAFKPLLEDPLFKGMVGRIPDERFDFQVSQHFSSRFSWGINGAINANSEQGMNYLLSTMLAYTWDTGMSERDALNALQRAVKADGSQPKGTIYYSETADIRTTTRKPGFAAAMLKLKKLGLQSEICQATVPPGRRDMIGAMLGAASINWPDYQCEIAPGAIVENLTSYGAVFGTNPGQTQSTDFLKWGAAGTCGTVVEPYALQQKFPHPMIQVHYARGCSLAESFYQSVEGPMQLLVLGDALCQPFAKFPKVRASEVPAEVKGTITIKLTKEEASPEIVAIEIYLDGRLAGRRSGLTDIAFESEKVSDGYHELRLVPIAAGLIQPRQTLRFPLVVNNRGESVQLRASLGENESSDGATLELSAKSALQGPIRVLRGAEVLGEAGKDSGKLKISAAKLGRGEVELMAVASDERGRDVQSRPLKVKINGEIRDKPEVITPPPPAPPKTESPAPPAKPAGGG